MKVEKSTALLERYGGIIPGGVHSNFRQPVYFERASGSRLYDVDGNEYIDCVVNNGACILGHGDPDVAAEVKKALQQGLTSGIESELSLKVAKQLHDMIPSAEQVRFANAGTEAVMKSLMLARCFTGREKIIKVEGAYHGWFDEAQVSVHPEPGAAGPPDRPIPVPSTGGIRQNTVDTVLIIPFNNLEALEYTLAANKGEVAALLLEPVVFNSGCIMPRPGYLEGVRRLTQKYDVVWIMDEVITGFRLAPGGAQERFGVTPDMSVFAKAIANGWPLSAVVGRKDIMSLSHPGGKVLYGGTYNGSQATLAAAHACLEKLKTGRIQKHLQALTDRLQDLFRERVQDRGLAARLEQFGGQYQVFFTDREIFDYRTACAADRESYLVFQQTVREQGIWMSDGYLFHHGVTDAHTDEDLDQIITAYDRGLAKVAERIRTRPASGRPA
ncbi:MAG: aspartate aminotransferase family protein [Desulfobacterales bacterium]|nr:MAG: aspartate aminotransferase family protein [Desulfobacterales bacterium]